MVQQGENREADRPQRAVLDNVLSEEDCGLLISLARSLSVVGYRPGVASATAFDVAACRPELLLPLVSRQLLHGIPIGGACNQPLAWHKLQMAARERVREAVEEALGLALGLLVEFTGVISWRPGGDIGWHHDANAAYLAQRAFSAVCYLNTAGDDFCGGSFLFRLGQPQEVVPQPGRVVSRPACLPARPLCA